MEEYKELVGYLAGTFTTISFLPQVIKTWRSRNAKDLSLPMFLIYFIGISLWLAYGIIRNDMALIAPNSISFVLAGIMLYFKLRY